MPSSPDVDVAASAQAGELVGIPQFSRNFPPIPDPLVQRDHLLEALAQAASAESPVVFVEGVEGSGVSTLLAQFAEKYQQSTFSLFIRPASRFAYSPEYLRLVLAEQYWWRLTGTRLDQQYVDVAEFETWQLRVRKLARQRPIYVTVDGLHQVPVEDRRSAHTILREVLPIGVDGFRFVIAGQQSEFEASLTSVRSKAYTLARFSDSESEKLLEGSAISQDQKVQVLRLCHGNPGRLASVRRLVASGVDVETILVSAPDKYLKFIGLEFAVIGQLTNVQKTLLAVLAFSKHSMGHRNLLDVVAPASASDIEDLILRCVFLTQEQSTSAIEFLSEAHRRFAETTLVGYKHEALALQVEHLIKSPHSESAIRLLPTYYQSLNKLQSIIDLISKEHYSDLFNVTQSISALKARASIGARSALELGQANAIFQFAVQRSIFSAVSNVEQMQSEVSALVALGKSKLALEIAAETASKEKKIFLLAEFARQSRERGMVVDPEIVSYIRELAEEIDFSDFGETAVKLAENILFVDPDLALKIVEIALKAEASSKVRDAAYVSLSMAATFGNGVDKSEIDQKANEKIGNEALQRLVRSVCTIAKEFSFDEIVKTVDHMQIERRIYFLRSLIASNTTRANILDVIDYALDQLIKNTSYSPKARDLADMARPLASQAQSSERVRLLVKRIEGQLGLVERGAPSKDLILLQMRLAHAEMCFDKDAAKKRIEEVYYTVASNVNIEIQAMCFSVMLQALESIDVDGALEDSGSLRILILGELKGATQSLLANTASHFKVSVQTIRALASSEPEEASIFVSRLNTEERRDRAYSAVARALVKTERTDRRAAALHSIVSKIVDGDVFEEAVLGAIEEASGAKFGGSWIKDIERTTLRISSASKICAGQIALVELMVKLKCTDSVKSHIEKFENTITRVDSLYERIDKYFALSAAVVDFDESKAAELYESGAAARRAATVSAEAGSVVLQTCLNLLMRVFRPLIKLGDLPTSHLDRFANVCEQIPCSVSKMTIYAELACKAWCEGRTDLCREIVNDRCRPMLERSRNTDDAIYGELCAIAFPAVHCAHTPSAYAIYEDIPTSFRPSVIFATSLMLLRRASPSEPWNSLEDNPTRVSHEAIVDLVELLRHSPTDANFYSVVHMAVKAVVHKVNRSKLTGQQKADFATKIQEMIVAKLPDPRNIQHQGYVIVASAQALRLVDAKNGQWLALIAQADSIDNLADRSLVLLELAECLPTRMEPERVRLLEVAKRLIEDIPAAADRYDRLESYIRIARRVSPPAAKRALREALLLTFDTSQPEEAARYRRNLVDIAEAISPSTLDELAEMIDDDPARAEAKADLKLSVEVYKLKKKISSVDGAVEPEALASKSLPSAAWKNVSALVSDRLVPQKPEKMSAYVDAAGSFSIQEAYPVLSWYIENGARRGSSGRDEDSMMLPLSEVMLLSTEIAASVMLKTTRMSASASKIDSARDEQWGSLVVKPGDRQLATDFLRRWLREHGTALITLSDPYFTKGDVEFLRLILASCPQCTVRILTSRNVVTENGQEFSAEAFLAEWNDLVEQEPPETEIVAVASLDANKGLVHDRWLYSDSAALRLGTSYKSLGVDKVSEISTLSQTEAEAIREQLNPFFNKQRVVNGIRVTYQTISF